jgi:hypothetical protein
MEFYHLVDAINFIFHVHKIIFYIGDDIPQALLPSGAKILDPSTFANSNMTSLIKNSNSSSLQSNDTIEKQTNTNLSNDMSSPFPPAPTPSFYTPRIPPPLPQNMVANGPPNRGHIRGPPSNMNNNRGPRPLPNASPALKFFEQQQNSYKVLTHKLPKGQMMTSSDVK